MPSPPRPYLRGKLPEVRKLLHQGKTHAQISKEVEVSTRSLSRWSHQGLLDLPSLSPAGLAPTDAPKRGQEQEWTARELLELGMGPAEAIRILAMLERTAAVSNPRFREWLSTYIPLVAKIHDEWAAAIAFLPILGRDLCNPALGTLAELMRESVPWEDEVLRRRYGREAKPLLREARIEFHDWLLFVTDPERVPEPPVGEAGLILEALRRCPHVDRPIWRRKPVHEEDKLFGLHFVREMPMGALTLSWSRLLDRNPPWLEAYADFAREFQGDELCVIQVETLELGRRSRLKWPRWRALWSR